MLKITHARGVTLIELIIALVIVSILALVAVPGVILLYQEYRLITNTENLYYVLQYARSAAIKNNQTIYVYFSTGTNWCYGINANATCDCTLTGSCGLGTYSASSIQDYSLSTTGLTNNTLQFEGSHGGASVSQITFTLGADSMSVSIGALGNMRVCSNQISGFPTCP